jgi:hypothetical protein
MNEPMTLRRITIQLSDEARAVLPTLAKQDMRYPKQQINYLIVEEAKRRGLLPQEDRNRAQDMEAGGAVAK